MAAGRLVVGSGRHGRGPGDGVATTTSANGGLDQPTGTATRAANRCWISLQVSSIAPGCRMLGVFGERGHHQERVRQHRQGHPPVPAAPAAHLRVVQAAQPLAGLERLLDGLITNGKFCCVWRMQLSLAWWHRPLRLRRSAFHTDAALVGEPYEPDLDRLPPAQPASRRPAPLGSGLPAAGALHRTRRPALAGADRRGGADCVRRSMRGVDHPPSPGPDHRAAA